MVFFQVSESTKHWVMKIVIPAISPFPWPSILLHISPFPFYLWRTVMASLCKTETPCEQHNERKDETFLVTKMTQYKFAAEYKRAWKPKCDILLQMDGILFKMTVVSSHILFLPSFLLLVRGKQGHAEAHRWARRSFMSHCLTKRLRPMKYKTGGFAARISM